MIKKCRYVRCENPVKYHDLVCEKCYDITRDPEVYQYPLIDYTYKMTCSFAGSARDIEIHERLDSLSWQIYFTAYDFL